MNSSGARKILIVVGFILSLSAASVPLFGIVHFQDNYFELVPVPIIAFTVILAAFGGLWAALRLSQAAGSRIRTALLLALPVLLSIGWATALHLKARNITIFAEFPYYIGYPEYPYALAGAMLVQKPYTREVFMIDSAGKKAEITRGSLFPAMKHLVPKLEDNSVITARGKDGALWMMQHPSSYTARLLTGDISGFKEQAMLPFYERYPIWLERGEDPVLTRHIDGEGDFFACLPYNNGKIVWRKYTKKWPACDYGSKKSKTAPPDAIIKKEILLYGKESWHLPGAQDQESPLFGYRFKTGFAYLIAAKGKNGPFTYFLHTGAKPQPAWPGYAKNGGPPQPRYGSRISQTVTGALWWRDWEINDPVYVYLVINEEGEPLPPFRLSSAMLKQAGVNGRNAVLLRATGNTAWINLEGKYMAKVSATDPARFTLWKFPKTTFSKARFLNVSHEACYALSVRAVTVGAMITAMNGVYLMDWEGKLKKLY